MSTLPAPTPLPTAVAGGSAAIELARLRAIRSGVVACSDEEVVALAMGGRVSGLSVARRLVDRLGGIAGVARATPGELVAAGASERSALALVAGVEVGRRRASAWPEAPWIVRTPADVGDRLLAEMEPLEREELRVLLLDTKNVVRGSRMVYLGNLAGSAVRVGEVFRDAVRACAASVVVVHNHPSGDPAPSGEDLRITSELADAGRLLDIELLDHVIVGRGRWTSLRALGAVDQSPATTR